MLTKIIKFLENFKSSLKFKLSSFVLLAIVILLNQWYNYYNRIETYKYFRFKHEFNRQDISVDSTGIYILIDFKYLSKIFHHIYT